MIETKQLPLIFHVDFILFLFSGYCWKIVNILVYLTNSSKILSWSMELKSFGVKTYYETKPFKVV